MKEAKTTMSRRTFAKAAGAAVAAGAMGLAGVACSSEGPSSSSSAAAENGDASESGLIPLTIGYWGGSPCELPMYIAREQGYWEEAGIEPNFMLITQDVSILLANEEIDVFESTPGDFPAIYQGMPLKHIDTIHVGCWSGVTNDPEIQSCKDLAGKRVGTTMMNGPAYTECVALCAREGGDPSQINWVAYTGSTIETALMNGEIDAACGSDATTYPIKYNHQDSVRFFYTSADELGEFYCCFTGVNANTLEKHPDVGDKIATAMAKAIDYINEDPDRASNESMEGGYMDSDYPDIQRGLTKNYLLGHGNEEDFKRSIKERWRELADAGLLTEAPVNPFTDGQLDDQANQQLDEYLDSLVDMVARWHGNAPEAAATADTTGVVVKLEQRGPAYVI